MAEEKQKAEEKVEDNLEQEQSKSEEADSEDITEEPKSEEEVDVSKETVAEESPEAENSESEEQPTEEEKAEEEVDVSKETVAEESPEAENSESEEQPAEEEKDSHIFALRTTANREDQVMDFVTSNATKKKLDVYSVIRPHGMRGYIFLEAAKRADAEQAAFSVPYARGILPNEIEYSEIEHMLEQTKVEYNIKKNDIVEIISGAFKREQAKVTRIDKAKEDVVVELLQAAVPIPITLKMDTVKVIRREGEEDDEE